MRVRGQVCGHEQRPPAQHARPGTPSRHPAALGHQTALLLCAWHLRRCLSLAARSPTAHSDTRRDSLPLDCAATSGQHLTLERAAQAAQRGGQGNAVRSRVVANREAGGFAQDEGSLLTIETCQLEGNGPLLPIRSSTPCLLSCVMSVWMAKSRVEVLTRWRALGRRVRSRGGAGRACAGLGVRGQGESHHGRHHAVRAAAPRCSALPAFFAFVSCAR
eukprot:1676830-Rhodomonas_salina.1